MAISGSGPGGRTSSAETGPHIDRVTGYSLVLFEEWAARKGLDGPTYERQRDRLRIAAKLHDVGKIGISDAILKKAGRLDHDEWRQMQQHTVIGARLFAECAAEQPDTEWTFEYSPETFCFTELDFALEVCEAVMDAWGPSRERPMILNLPDTVEVAMPNVYADQIEWFIGRLKRREAAYHQSPHAQRPGNRRGSHRTGVVGGSRPGYEEAACQGLMAGINAHQRAKKLDPLILKRSDAYIGVLINDLISKGTQEPYRMFTSRAEFRTLLRQENADLRLTELSYRIGLASQERMDRVKNKRESVDKIKTVLKEMAIKPDEINGWFEKTNSSPIVEKQKTQKDPASPGCRIERIG